MTVASTTHRFTALKVARLDRGLALFDLARRVRVSPARVAAIEEGWTRPTAEEIARLADAFAMTVDDLLAPVTDVEMVPLRVEPSTEARRRVKDRRP